MVWPSHRNKPMEAVQECSGLLCKRQAAPPSPRLSGIAGTSVPIPGTDAQGQHCPRGCSRQRWSCPNPAPVSPRNFLGGLSRSPAAGSTTHRSSTSLQGDKKQEQGVNKMTAGPQ